MVDHIRAAQPTPKSEPRSGPFGYIQQQYFRCCRLNLIRELRRQRNRAPGRRRCARYYVLFMTVENNRPRAALLRRLWTRATPTNGRSRACERTDGRSGGRVRRRVRHGYGRIGGWVGRMASGRVGAAQADVKRANWPAREWAEIGGVVGRARGRAVGRANRRGGQRRRGQSHEIWRTEVGQAGRAHGVSGGWKLQGSRGRTGGRVKRNAGRPGQPKAGGGGATIKVATEIAADTVQKAHPSVAMNMRWYS